MKPRLPRLSGVARRGLAPLAILVVAALARPAHAEPVSLSFAQGTHLFRRILHDSKLVPLRDFDELAKEPAGKLLIVLGDTQSLDEWSNLRRFVEQGGAVLLATDRDCKNVLRPFGVQVVGDLLRVDSKSPYAYKQSEDCILLRRGGKGSPLFENLSVDSVDKDRSRVATNRPGYLVSNGDSPLKLLATFPPGCTTASHTRYRNRILPFAMGGTWGRGRILILSDHSVFINAMMWQPDIENFDFAYNCVNWLTEAGKRKEVLFVEEGQIRTKFEIPLKDPPMPPLPPLKAIVEAVDKGLGEMESGNVVNTTIHDALTNLASPERKWLMAVTVIATSFLGLFALARLSQGRHRPEKLAPLAASPPGQSPSSSLYDQRHRSMQREGNFWEAARALARQGFESGLGVPVPRSQQPLPAGARMPPLKRNGNWWQDRRLRRRVQRLWQLAYGTEPVRISSRQLKRLGPEIEFLKSVFARSNLADGRSSAGSP